MTFYNPLFYNYPPFFNKQSTNHAKNVNNSNQKSSFQPKSQNNFKPTLPGNTENAQNPNTKNPSLPPITHNQFDNKKSNHQTPLNLGIFSNYLHETDNLIILALLYFLYTQKSSNMPLMLCLLLLLTLIRQ